MLAEKARARLGRDVVGIAGVRQAPDNPRRHRHPLCQPGDARLMEALDALPRTITCLAVDEPVGDAGDQRRIDVGHAAHIAELLQAVRREHRIGRRIAEEAEAARLPRHLERRQALVTEVDVLLGLHLDLG